MDSSDDRRCGPVARLRQEIAEFEYFQTLVDAGAGEWLVVDIDGEYCWEFHLLNKDRLN